MRELVPPCLRASVQPVTGRTAGRRVVKLVTLASSAQVSMENSRLVRDSRVQLRYGTALGRAPGLLVDEGVAWLRAETRALKVHARPPQ